MLNILFYENHKMKASAMKVRQRIADDLSGIQKKEKKRNLNLTNHRFLDVK